MVVRCVVATGPAGFALSRARAWRDNRLNAAVAQPLADTPGIRAAVSRKALGARASPRSESWQRHLREHRCGLSCRMRLARREPGIKWQSIAVGQEVDFGREAAH